jgi:drug/metabolite transporter (DMT)-like permease
MSAADPMLATHAEREVRARRQGYIALLSVQFFFGLFPLFGKLAFEQFSARSIVAWRIGVGAGALALLTLWLHGRGAWPRREDWPRLVLCSLLGIVVNMVLFLEGLKRSTAVNTALLLPLIPVFTAAVAIALRQERFDRTRAIGMAIAFSGAVLLVVQHGAKLESEHLTGNVLVVVNEICYAIYLVIARPLLAKYPPLVVVTWVFVLSVWAIPFLIADGSAWPPHPNSTSLASMAYIVVFPTILAYLLNVYALARVSSSTTAAFIFVQPSITVLGGVFWLREDLPDHMWIATALTFAGVWIVARRRVRSQAPTANCSLDAQGNAEP